MEAPAEGVPPRPAAADLTGAELLSPTNSRLSREGSSGRELLSPTNSMLSPANSLLSPTNSMLSREGSSGREREFADGEQPPEGVVLKQKPYTKVWIERYAKIEGGGLWFYAHASDTTPRTSSIEDLRRCVVRTIGMEKVLQKRYFLVTLERQGDEHLPDLQDDGASRFGFELEEDRTKFAMALRNLAAGLQWDAPPPDGGSPAVSPLASGGGGGGLVISRGMSVDSALSLASTTSSFEIERTESPSGALVEGWLEKWRRSKRFDLSRSGHWEKLYFVLEPKEKGLRYFKADPSQKNGATWKELLFEHMGDAHVMWDTGQFAQGEEAVSSQAICRLFVIDGLF